MGSQDQHRQKEPQTAADALERAAELTAQADAADKEAGHYASHELREQARALKTRARDLKQQERRARQRETDRKVRAHIQVHRAQHTPGQPVPDLDELLGGDAA